jgi:hypothetical protein
VPQKYIDHGDGFYSPAQGLVDAGGNPIGTREGVLLPSAARTVLQVVNGPANYNARGLILFLNVTAASGTGGLVTTIFGLDPVSDGELSLNAAPAARVATGLVAYVLYPGVAGSYGPPIIQATALPLPQVWGVRVSVGDASSYTYSLAYCLLP